MLIQVFSFIILESENLITIHVYLQLAEPLDAYQT